MMTRSFWAIVRREARAQGMTKVELIDKVGLTRTEYNRARKQAFPPAHIGVLFAAALGVSARDLVQPARG